MWDQAQIAAAIVAEIDAFLLAHEMSENEFTAELGSDTHLIRRLRKGGSLTTYTIGKMGAVMRKRGWRGRDILCPTEP